MEISTRTRSLKDDINTDKRSVWRVKLLIQIKDDINNLITLVIDLDIVLKPVRQISTRPQWIS